MALKAGAPSRAPAPFSNRSLPGSFYDGIQKPGFWLNNVTFRTADNHKSNDSSIAVGKNLVSPSRCPVVNQVSVR